MVKMHVRHVCFGLALASYALFGGCGKKEYKAAPIDESLLPGNWVQIEREKTTARMNQRSDSKAKGVRHLTINADKTFTFTICDASGKPIGDKKAEGTLAVNTEKHEITYNVTTNTFKSDDAGATWVPASSYTIQKELVDGTETLVLSVTEVGGSTTRYKQGG